MNHRSSQTIFEQLRTDGYAVTVNMTRATVTTKLPSGSRKSVEVYGPDRKFGTAAPASVNWAGIGSVDAADAEAYGQMIKDAARLATAWNEVAA